jgi:Fic family protein
MDFSKPYNHLPLLPPSNELETRRVLKACIEARSALAELKVASHFLPNQSVLVNTIPLLEARDSSEIENIVTTADELFRHSAHAPEEAANPATKETLRYRSALWTGFESLKKKPFSTATAIDVCSTLKGKVMDIRSTPGTTLKNDQTGEVIYTPPEGEKLIRDKMSNWEKFLHDEDSIDPLVRMAVGHYQFEAIHPFNDGNGRTGRILNILYLVSEGLLDLPVLYLSHFITKNKPNYYHLLRQVTAKQDWEPWILYMLQATEKTAQWTGQKISATQGLMNATQEKVKQDLPKIYSYELIEVLFSQPYCRIANLVENKIAKRQTASEYLKALVKIGVLQEEASGREKIFINENFMKILKT